MENMENAKIGVLRLSGEDSVRMANSLIRPSQEEIAKRNRILDDIESSVHIRRTEDGMEVDVEDLDLKL